MNEPTTDYDVLRVWPFIAYRGTCIVNHEPFRTRFRIRMWWHERRCSRFNPPAETDGGAA